MFNDPQPINLIRTSKPSNNMCYMCGNDNLKWLKQYISNSFLTKSVENKIKVIIVLFAIKLYKWGHQSRA